MAAAKAAAREWVLKPESEYRFELDPGTTLAVKVSYFCLCVFVHLTMVGRHEKFFISLKKFATEHQVSHILEPTRVKLA